MHRTHMWDRAAARFRANIRDRLRVMAEVRRVKVRVGGTASGCCAGGHHEEMTNVFYRQVM